MDVVIPSHSIKLFNSSIVSFSKIGKDLYLEFDSVTGLSLRTLNNGKSAYAHVHFEPSFFERCTAPPVVGKSRKRRRVRKASSRSSSSPVSSSSTFQDDHDPLDDEQDSDDNDADQDSTAHQQHQQQQLYACRIPLSALQAVVRNRKKTVQSLRITAPTFDASQLQFEFSLQHHPSTAAAAASDHHHHGASSVVLLTVVHTVQVTAPCRGVSACTDTDCPASELVAAPVVLSRLLEPLQRTSEAALIVRCAGHNNNSNNNNTNTGTVSASSFHPETTTSTTATTRQNKKAASQQSTTNNNAIWQGTQASVLKSETSVSVDEFLEFDFVSNRDTLADDVLLPEEVNREVILVFSLKECRAVLQFLGSLVEEVLVTLSFRWGGQPITLQAAGEQSSWSIHLVLATLDYKLLTALRTTE